MLDDIESSAPAHHPGELHRALGALSTADLGKLKSAARAWVFGFGLEPAVYGVDDLVAEAMFRTASGRRRWKAGIGLVHHLVAVMRSIAESWRKSAERRAVAGAAEIGNSQVPLDDPDSDDPEDDVETSSPVDSAPSREPDALRRLVGREQVEAFERHFAGDSEASHVLDGWWWGRTGLEIQERTGMSKRQYVAASLRIRRYAQGARDQEVLADV